MSTLIDTTLADRYRIEATLGRGATATVYRARHLVTGHDVAIKMMHPERALDPEQARRFRDEAERAASLRHPNTVRVFDSGVTDDGRPYLVMEHLRGHTLAAELAREGPMAPARVLPIMAQVLRALREAHEAGVVHRDLKPDNVILAEVPGETDHVKVIDFGLARATRTEVSRTHPGVLMGTPEYMSPEQCHGLPVDARSDLYALGCTAFHMLTGQPPFAADDTVALLLMHCHQSAPELRRALPTGVDCPPGLSPLIASLLSKRPGDRPPDAATALAEVDRMLVARTPVARPRARPRAVMLTVMGGIVALSFLLPRPAEPTHPSLGAGRPAVTAPPPATAASPLPAPKPAEAREASDARAMIVELATTASTSTPEVLVPVSSPPRLAISSRPAGARITVREGEGWRELCARTPCEVARPAPGSRLRATLGGYSPRTAEVGDGTVLSFLLQRRTTFEPPP